jgi:hypothetical protein
MSLPCEDNVMDKWEFLKWRRTLGYTQAEAGEKLGYGRGTVCNWEGGAILIPQAVELACCELTRRSKQRPDFGPVNLVCGDNRVQSCALLLRCELFSNNEAAIERALDLDESFINAMILEDGGGVVWSVSELLCELERRRDETRLPGAARERRGNLKKRRSTPAG